MLTGHDINSLAQEARYRWLKPPEVYSILKNYEEHQLTHQVPQRPESGSLYLFNKRVLKFFRKDGHNWRRRRDQRTIAEAHERLKVGNIEALNCYYAHGEDNANFQRRSYWILDQEYEHIVLVHYRDITEGIQNALPTICNSPNSSTPSSTLNSIHQSDSSVVIDGFYEPYNNESSPSSVEISSHEGITNHGLKLFRFREGTKEVSQALQRIEQQLSLNDEEVKEMNTFYIEHENSNELEDMLHGYDLSAGIPDVSDNLLQQKHLGAEIDLWKDMLDSSKNFPDFELQAQFGRQNVQQPAMNMPQVVSSMQYPAYPTLFNQDQIRISPGVSRILTIPQKKFTIREISPEWCYTSDSEAVKVIIIGSFLCNPSEGEWACMFGDTEVPVQLIQEGVLSCHAPPHLHGEVTVCITSKNHGCCSEVRVFEYRDKPGVDTHNYTFETKSSDELLLLVRLVQMLLSDTLSVGVVPESREAEDSWNQIIDALLIGNSTSTNTMDWLVQELLKDKLELWLSSRLRNKNQNDCSLSKKEQGIMHMVAGLGFEWALLPILNSGVSVNFRDINGWTALHWAARFGREKMVASLIASGALAGAVTDPNAQDPTGRTPASIADTCGHKGLAGYLSEVSLTSHLSSLVLDESELSKGTVAEEAERAVNDPSKPSCSKNEDQVSLNSTLAAVRRASQAAARIQSAFRAHSFRKRQEREAMFDFTADNEDEFSALENEIRGLSAASKLAFRNAREYNSAALSIQKKYRGWKGRKDFLTIRQKVVKIQAHVRGYQVRKNYKVCWAVGILEKVVLRWRRRGVGLRGFRHELDCIDEEEEEDEDILKVFRKQKVDAAIDEAVSRVLSMVDSPEARLQYHRILEKYSQAKAELRSVDSGTSSSLPYQNVFNLENVENHRLT